MEMSSVVSESEEEMDVPQEMNGRQKEWYIRFAKWYAKRKHYLRPGRLTHQPQNSAEIMHLNFLEHYDKKIGPRDCGEEETSLLAEVFAHQYRNHKGNFHRRASVWNVHGQASLKKAPK